MQPTLEKRLHAWSRTPAVCLALSLLACGGPGHEANSALRETLLVENAGGQQGQGTVLNEGGQQGQGPRLEAYAFASVTLNGQPLNNVHIDRGELVAELDGAIVRGTQLVGARAIARYVDSLGNQLLMEQRIATVQPELATRDLEPYGATYLYRVEYQDALTGEWKSICGVDADGNSLAIPVSGIWDQTASRVDTTTEFTFACTSGAIGKCYRWGYRPWVAHPDGPEVMKDAHQACTRLARADYCGDGKPHTIDGTQIVIWDHLSAPGPYQEWVAAPGMSFEAGWGPNGALCLNHPRWIDLVDNPNLVCGKRIIPPGQIQDGRIVQCGDGPLPVLFTDSQVNKL